MNKVVNFIIANGEGRYTEMMREELEEALKEHEKYGTLMVVNDSKGLAAVARWNWESKDTAKILDTVIRKDVRGIKSIKGILLLGIKNNPDCKYIKFDRTSKYPDRKDIKYKINNVLRRE